MSELSNLTFRRGQIKAKVTRCATFLKNYRGGDTNQISARLSSMEDAFKEFDLIQSDIEKLDPDTDYNEERLSFERHYFDVMSMIKGFLNEQTRAASVVSGSNISDCHNRQSNNGNAQSETINVRLPTLNLPPFSGSYSEWLSFYDTFNSLIHENGSLTDVQKFHYLKSCLKNEALRSIEALAISNANYASAWAILKRRYENKRLIVQEHIYSIINTPAVNRSTSPALRQLLDTVTLNIEALKVLNLPVESWDALLVPIITLKFDFCTKREWETNLNSEIPKFAQLVEFLEKRCQLLESLGSSNSLNNTKPATSIQNRPKTLPQNSLQQNRSRSSSYLSITKKISCFFCKGPHTIVVCPEFLKLPVNERLRQVERLQLCENCLRMHRVEQCRSAGCRQCGEKHHTLLHTRDIQSITEESNNSLVNNHCSSKPIYSQVVLSTAIVLIADKSGNYHKCRALLDSGSQINLISASFVDKLKIKTTRTNVPIIGINQNESMSTQCANINIKSQHGSFTAKLTCMILPKITGNLPLTSFPISELQIPDNINLADSTFNISAPIDLLVGADLFWQLLCVGQVKLEKTQLYLQKTHLGWIMGGQLLGAVVNQATCVSTLTSRIDQNLQEQISRFWEVDELPLDHKSFSPEERACEVHFTTSHKRDNDGRFIVKLPFRYDEIKLGDSKEYALKRFYSLERKLMRQPLLKEQYSSFMHEFLNLNHMELVPANEINNTTSCFLPHHAVVTDGGRKFRTVFDGSMKTTNGQSLNDQLMAGPTIQQDLFSILVRFRTHKYVFTADVSKMYRQIKVDKSHVDFQRIFWRDNPHQPLQIYRITRVTYGTSCAPFLAIRCLKQLAEEAEGAYPLASAVIRNDFYVDDLLTGVDSIQEGMQLRDQIIHILEQGGFQLSKWVSNNIKLLPPSLQNYSASSVMINFDKNGNTKTLGLLWNCKQDIFKFQFTSKLSTNKVTKRSILATVMQIYDPLGLISPVVVKAKIIIQQIWTLCLGWDEQVPHHILVSWKALLSELKHLNDLRIPRMALSEGKPATIELHGFSDASMAAFGANIYLKSKDAHGNITTRLVCSKSRVAPLKTISLARLELCGALLLARLINKVVRILHIKIDNCYLYTDSTIVLAWLASPSSTWQTFVANRVSEIQTLTNIENWHHVRGDDNPADAISRGMYPTHLLQHESWFHGPSWLSDESDNWVQSNVDYRDLEVPEKRKVTLTITAISPEWDVLLKFSSFAKLQRTIAFCLRFLHNCKNRDKRIGSLSCAEMQAAHNSIIKNVQYKAFRTEISNLKLGKNIDKKSQLLSLDPFISNNGLLRVGGRIKNARIAFDKKHQIILPAKQHVSQLIIRQCHERQLHAGYQLTLASLRQKYWLISARNTLRKIIHGCVLCFRNNPKSIIQKMGDLPAERVQPLRPFIKSGVDYAGPILIREGKGRGKRVVKSYIALFICCSTKAVHIELVGDLTSESFLNALKRFMSRRGNVSHLLSDNGSNFVGARRELSELYKFLKSSTFAKEVVGDLELNNVSWKFIPPHSPHMGGLWEAAIKAAKYHLRRIMGDAALTYEELYTLLTRIEACLNSRPLTPLSNDPHDLSILTPGHFLIGEPLTAPIEYDVCELKINRLSRWERVEQLRQHFWRRWSTEYLTQLQTRSKWHRSSPTNLQPGTMVLIKDESSPPLRWPLGRIVQLHTGADGVVRVATIKTSVGVVRRTCNKLCVLPIEANEPLN